MYVCKKCGQEHAEPNAFCSCGEFVYPADLRPSSTAIPPATDAAVERPEPVPERPTTPPPHDLAGLPTLGPTPADAADAPGWFPGGRGRRSRAGGPQPPAVPAGEPAPSAPAGSAPPGTTGPRTLRVGERSGRSAPEAGASTTRAAAPAGVPAPVSPTASSPFTARSPHEAGIGATDPPDDGRPATASDAPIQGLALKLDRALVETQPGAAVVLNLTVRNTGALVEGCSVQILGIPADWLRVEPPKFNLDIDKQQDVKLHLTPPRSAKTPSGSMALRVEVASMISDEVRSGAEFTLIVDPFYDLAVSLEPAEIDGKRQARTYVSIQNKGNVTEDLELTGTENGNRLRFTFRPTVVQVRSGQWTRVPVDVRARRRVWGGAERMRPFAIGARRRTGPEVPAAQGRLTQQASWPRWVIPAMIAVLAIAVPFGAILFVRSLNKKELTGPVVVPKLIAKNKDGVTAELAKLGLVADLHLRTDAKAEQNTIVAQDPGPGKRLTKGDTVTLYYASSAVVPDIKDLDWGDAKDDLEADGLQMYVLTFVSGPAEKYGQIQYQDPKAGQPSRTGIVKVKVYQASKLVSLVNMQYIPTKQALESQKIKVDIVEQFSPLPRGIILEQQPPAGADLFEGASVVLKVSKGPEPDGAAPAAPTTVAAAAPPPTPVAAVAPTAKVTVAVPPTAAPTVAPTAAPARTSTPAAPGTTVKK